jgi:hypothetical protein
VGENDGATSLACVSDGEEAELRNVKAAIDAIGGDQIFVPSLLGDARFVDYHDPVGILNRSQAVRDDERGPAHRKLGE